MNTVRDVELRIPVSLIDSARQLHPTTQSDEDWHQCDVVKCGRWYQRKRPVAIQLYATARNDGKDEASFTVAVYELRWACPACSGYDDGQNLGHMDSFYSQTEADSSELAACDWCLNLGHEACSKEEHDKADWDNDDNYDYKAAGIRLPPNWIAGHRTRSTDLTTYKVYLMFCRTCGEVLQPDRPDRFIKHMNTRARDTGLRACMVPELDYLLQHEPGTARAEDRPPLDPAQPILAAVELIEVFKFQPRKELGRIASRLHWELAKRIARGDDDVRGEIFADVDAPELIEKLTKYSEHVLNTAGPENDDMPNRQLLHRNHKELKEAKKKRKDAGTGNGGAGAGGKKAARNGGASGVNGGGSGNGVSVSEAGMLGISGGGVPRFGEQSQARAVVTVDAAGFGREQQQQVGLPAPQPQPHRNRRKYQRLSLQAQQTAGAFTPAAAAAADGGSLQQQGSAASPSWHHTSTMQSAGSCEEPDGFGMLLQAAEADHSLSERPYSQQEQEHRQWKQEPAPQEQHAGAGGGAGGSAAPCSTGGCSPYQFILEAFMHSERQSLQQLLLGLEQEHERELSALRRHLELQVQAEGVPALQETARALELALAEQRQRVEHSRVEAARLKEELRQQEEAHARKLEGLESGLRLSVDSQLLAVRRELQQQLSEKEHELANLKASLDDRVAAEVRRRLR